MDTRLLIVVIAVAILGVTLATQWRRINARDGRMFSPQALGILAISLAIGALMLLAVLASLGYLPWFEGME